MQELEEQLKTQKRQTKNRIFYFALMLKWKSSSSYWTRREKAHKSLWKKFSKDILNTIDNLERALATPANKEDESVKALFDDCRTNLKRISFNRWAFWRGAGELSVKPLILIYIKPFQCNQLKALKPIKLASYCKKRLHLKWSSHSPSDGNGGGLIYILSKGGRFSTVFLFWITT